MANEITSDRKAERLINLTMALLATPRYMTKSEVFERVEGYEGSEESKSRMFERDKDDLREIGIVIDVGSNDPLFDDEQGYRISSESYALALPELSREEFSLISIAVSLWKNELFSSTGQSALRKIQSLNPEVAEPLLPKNLFNDEVPHAYFDDLWRAITERTYIEFLYSGSSLKNRTIAPYSLTLWHGYWYLTGLDLELDEIRTFKALRIVDGVRVTSKAEAYAIPHNFHAKDYLSLQDESDRVNATFAIRKGLALSLRATSTVEERAGEWDSATKSYSSKNAAISDLMFYGDAVRIESPTDLKSVFLERISRTSRGESA